LIGNRTSETVKEYGDYQTPDYFVDKICLYLRKELNLDPDIIFEPTFGLGSFIIGCLKAFKNIKKIFGVEINKTYFNICKKRIDETVIKRDIEVHLFNDDIFVFDFDNIKSHLDKNENLLIVGNPPWITNSELSLIGSINMPLKDNFKGLNGLDAITGKSNFDIAEYILLQLLSEFKYYNCTIAMLCKNIVAKNIVRDLRKFNFKLSDIRFLGFDAGDVFGISCEAGLLIMRFGEKGKSVCDVYDFYNPFEKKRMFGWIGDNFISDIGNYMQIINIDGKCQFEWRQGIKHDCSKVMELSTRQPDGTYLNGMGNRVDVEDGYIYPLIKSSDLKNVVITATRKSIIVPQKKIKEETDSIKQNAPKLWRYLEENSGLLDGRKSSIYKNSPRFSIFGVGDYAFKPFKVAISGFNKKSVFALVYNKQGKPIMLDDTCYYLGFDDFKISLIAMLILNSKIVQEFIKSIAFLDSKRPYTKEILMRIDFLKVVKVVTFNELVTLAKELGVDYRFTKEDFRYFIQYLSTPSENNTKIKR